MTSFVHAADIHLGGPMVGLARRAPAAADAMSGAVEAAFRALIDETLARRADLLLIAGDLFDRSALDLRAAFFAARQLERAVRAGVRVVMIAGNHDAEARAAADAVWPDGVVVFGGDHPGQVVFDELGVAVAGQSFGARAETRNLAAGYPPPAPGLFNIALLHTSCDAAGTGPAAHGVYAPTTPAELARLGYDYWALGHIHEAAVLAQAPWIVYPGCLQGRRPQETGPKGAVHVTLRPGAAPAEAVALSPITLDVARWSAQTLDLTGAEREAEIETALRSGLRAAADAGDGRPVLARLSMVGETALDATLRRTSLETWLTVAADAAAEANGAGGAPVFVEKVVIRTAPPGRQAAEPALDPVFSACLRDARADPAVAAALAELTGKLAERARDALGREEIGLEDPQALLDAGATLIEAAGRGGRAAAADAADGEAGPDVD